MTTEPDRPVPKHYQFGDAMRFALFTLLILSPGLAMAQEALVPLSTGNTWTYKSKITTGVAGLGTTVEGTMTASCAGREDYGGTPKFKIYVKDSLDDYKNTIWLSSDSRTVKSRRSTANNGFFLLPIDLDNTSHTASLRVEDTTVKITVKSSASPENIKVPAGTFKAYKSSSKVKVTKEVEIQSKVWYAPGTGPVKIIEKVTTEGVVVERVMLLSKFKNASSSPKLPETGEAPKPEKAKTGEKEAAAGLPSLITKAVKAGRGSGAFKALRSWLTTLEERCDSDTDMDPEFHEDTSPKLFSGNGAMGTVRDSMIVSNGDVTGLFFKGSLVLVHGNLTATAYIKDCLIIVTGNVISNGYIKDCVVISLGTVTSSGYLKNCAVEAKAVKVGGYAKENLFLNTPTIPSGKDNQSKKTSPKLGDCK